MRVAGLVLALVLTATGARADTILDQSTAALQEAIAGFAQADSGPDKAAALTDALVQYEIASAALRATLRASTIAEARLSAEQAVAAAGQEALLGALLALAPLSEEGVALHPGGPLATARAAGVLADMLPVLRQRVEDMNAAANRLDALVAARAAALRNLQETAADVGEARSALLAMRADARLAETDAQVALRAQMQQDADSLEAVSDLLVGSVTAKDAGAPRGLSLPVTGTLLRQFGEADAAGIARPGWVMATPATALVRAPGPASVLYAGPVKGLGRVVVLEPAPGHMLILAGLGALLTSTGETLNTGAGIGFTGTSDTLETHTNVTDLPEGAGTHLPDTLYMEARTRDGPVDPGDWFAPQKD